VLPHFSSISFGLPGQNSSGVPSTGIAFDSAARGSKFFFIESSGVF